MDDFHHQFDNAGLHLVGNDPVLRVVATFAEHFVARRLALGALRTAVGTVSAGTGPVGWPATTTTGWLLAPDAQGAPEVVVDASAFAALCAEFDAARRAVEWPHLFRPDPVAEAPAAGEEPRMAALERAWALARGTSGRARVLTCVDRAFTTDAVFAPAQRRQLEAWGLTGLVHLLDALAVGAALARRLGDAGIVLPHRGSVAMPVAVELVENGVDALETVALTFFGGRLAGAGPSGETVAAGHRVRWRREFPDTVSIVSVEPLDEATDLGDDVG